MYVSRTHPNLIKGLFELEVPEISEGIVEIKSVAREPGQRSKIAVSSGDERVDPVGACVGHRGTRVQSVVNELYDEKVDIVRFSEDTARFIAEALSPAKPSHVAINAESNTATVIMPDNQLSLAIGKAGQNVRLAAKLTGWRIDIRSESQAAEDESNAQAAIAKEQAAADAAEAARVSPEESPEAPPVDETLESDSQDEAPGAEEQAAAGEDEPGPGAD